MKSTRNAAVVYINSKRHELRGEEAFMMLADYLRYSAGLTGTKIVCAEGDCGACSVLKASYFGGRPATFEPVNACIVMMAQLDGCHIVTVEGLKTDEGLSPVQDAMVRCHASQCGYCTPGFAIAITNCVARGKQSEQGIKNALTGNLCRCTGYSPLIEAAMMVDAEALPSIESRYLSAVKHEDLQGITAQALHLSSESHTFFAPTTIKDAVKLRKAHSGSRLLASGTDIGVMINKGKSTDAVFISLHLIEGLYAIRREGTRFHVGARVTLSEVHDACQDLIPEFAKLLNIFASPQIKNIGTLIGNVANGSPIGDTLPFLMVANATVHTVNSRGERTIPIESLYVGYRQLALQSDEIISSISFDVPKLNETLKLYKASQRKDLDIATVSCAFSVRQARGTITEARLAVGGVGATVIRLTEVEAFLLGKILSEDLIEASSQLLQQSIKPLSDVRGTNSYRRVLVDGLFRKYFSELGGQV
ncbi:MAG: FAD binding domain-containing protein [Chitinophagaceae bacterium]|nr:FAD binding domain-containing protein [Oligoflexus sp.]